MTRKALHIMSISSILVTGCATAEHEQPVGVLAKWTLVEEFSDEFDGTDVDSAKWTRNVRPWGERAWRPENVYTKDGVLHIRAAYDPHEHKGNFQHPKRGSVSPLGRNSVTE